MCILFLRVLGEKERKETWQSIAQHRQLSWGSRINIPSGPSSDPYLSFSLTYLFLYPAVFLLLSLSLSLSLAFDRILSAFTFLELRLSARLQGLLHFWRGVFFSFFFRNNFLKLRVCDSTRRRVVAIVPFWFSIGLALESGIVFRYFYFSMQHAMRVFFWLPRWIFGIVCACFATLFIIVYLSTGWIVCISSRASIILALAPNLAPKRHRDIILNIHI